MDEESQRFRRITMKVLTMQLNSTSVMDIIAYGGAAVGMIVTLSEFLKGSLSVHGALMLILLASEFFIPLRLLGVFFSHCHERHGGQRPDFCASGSAGAGTENGDAGRFEAGSGFFPCELFL